MPHYYILSADCWLLLCSPWTINFLVPSFAWMSSSHVGLSTFYTQNNGSSFGANPFKREKIVYVQVGTNSTNNGKLLSCPAGVFNEIQTKTIVVLIDYLDSILKKCETRNQKTTTYRDDRRRWWFRKTKTKKKRKKNVGSAAGGGGGSKYYYCYY